MTHRLIAAALLAAIAATPAFAEPASPAPATAAQPEKALSPQQQKMKDCNADAKAKALAGDERKAFMKTCLSKEGAPAAESAAETKPLSGREAQQQKMKDCNKEASEKSLKGKERKSFMSTCLKAD
jgi:hypothetical protein